MITCFFFFKQKTAYEMRISDWSSDVCSSDLLRRGPQERCVQPLGNHAVDVFLAVESVVEIARIAAVEAAHPQRELIPCERDVGVGAQRKPQFAVRDRRQFLLRSEREGLGIGLLGDELDHPAGGAGAVQRDRKSTRLNS